MHFCPGTGLFPQLWDTPDCFLDQGFYIRGSSYRCLHGCPSPIIQLSAEVHLVRKAFPAHPSASTTLYCYLFLFITLFSAWNHLIYFQVPYLFLQLVKQLGKSPQSVFFLLLYLQHLETIHVCSLTGPSPGTKSLGLVGAHYRCITSLQLTSLQPSPPLLISYILFLNQIITFKMYAVWLIIWDMKYIFLKLYKNL